MNADIIEQLAAAVADRIQPKDGLWSARTIAAHMDIDNYRQVLERYAPHPQFPKAIRVPVAGGGRGQPRWKAEEIRAWWDSHKEDASCRRRKKVRENHGI